MAGLWYLTLSFVVAGPLFREGPQRLDNLWYLFMSPTFDEGSPWVLAAVVLASALLGLAGLVNPYSPRLSAWLSHHEVGARLAGLGLLLFGIALWQFSRPVTIAYGVGAGLLAWSWRRADPDDGWF